MAEASDYREFAVDPLLAPHLVCLWTSTAAGPQSPQPILPDACVDIVFVGDAPPIVAGPATVPVLASLPEGAALTGARFRPGGAPAWVGAAAHEMRNMDVPLRALWGPEAGRLHERVAGAASPAARRAALRDGLAGRLGRVRPEDALIDAAIGRLARDLSLRTGDLSRDLFLSERQFLRRFRERVGYGPKTLQRILRLQRLLLLAQRPEFAARGMAALASAAGYADQAHMAREVRALSGETAQSLLRRSAGTLALSDLFNAPAGLPG